MAKPSQNSSRVEGKDGLGNEHGLIALKVVHYGYAASELIVAPADAKNSSEGARYYSYTDITPVGDGSGVIAGYHATVGMCNACFVFRTNKEGIPEMRMRIDITDRPDRIQARILSDQGVSFTKRFNFSGVSDREFVRIGEFEREPTAPEQELP